MPADLPLAAIPVKAALHDVYNAAKGPVKKRFAQYRTDRRAKKIYGHLRDIGKVRTIWQTDRPTPIKAFYYPQNIEIEKRRIPIKKLADLTRISNRIVVQGIVGQGKSIFLRHLCVEEIKSLTSIPVFLELRRFTRQESLAENIQNYLEDIGLDSSQETFEYLAESGKLHILLDAYDEIGGDIEPNVFKDVERLCRKYPELTVIITSRPNYNIQTSELFTITTISPLESDDLPPLLRKLCPDNSSADDIYRGIEANGDSVVTLLTTPLMVTLLVFVYKADKIIPTKPIEFYDSLFSTVLSRHDKLKPGGVNRSRKTSVSDTTFQRIFDCVSFLSSQASMTSLKENMILGYVEKAKQYANADLDSEKYLEEVCRITCLILKDGFDYNYLHKSIQEYHAARFVASIPEVKAIEFYDQISAPGKWTKWRQQIEFLFELDGYRSNKYFVLKSCGLALGQLFDDDGNIKPYLVTELLEETRVGLYQNEDGSIEAGSVSLSGKVKLHDEASKQYASSGYMSALFNILSKFEIDQDTVSPLIEGNAKNIRDGNGPFHIAVRLKDLVDLCYDETSFIVDFEVGLRELILSMEARANEIIRQLEDTDSIFRF